MPTTGEVLTAAREARDLYRREVADKVGVSDVTVGLWEKDRHRPRREHARALESFFDLPPRSIPRY